MINKLLARLRATRSDESGMTITEVLVSFAIALTVILPMVMVMGNSFHSQSVSESRDKAVQLARDYIEESRQVSFSELAVTADQASAGIFENGLGGKLTYNGENIAVLPAGYTSALSYGPYQEVTIGKSTFEARAYITKVQNNTFDGTASYLDNTQVYPKRITVVVTWATGDEEHEVVQSWVRAPQIGECIPTVVLDSASASLAPIGCKV